MVDIKFLFNPEVVKKTDILRRRCRKTANKSITCKLEQNNVRKVCNCRANNINNDFLCIEDDDPQIKRRYILGSIGILVVLGLILGAYCTGAFEAAKPKDEEEKLNPPNPTVPLPASKSVMRVFTKAAVCADSAVCAQVGKLTYINYCVNSTGTTNDKTICFEFGGKHNNAVTFVSPYPDWPEESISCSSDILKKNGTAVDAAIATLFCNGVVTMQSMGLGGGFLMTIYRKSENKAYFLNAREKAPIKAKSELYRGDQSISRDGALAIGVPGELKGYWELYQKFGTLEWKDLIQPSVDVCNKGYIMSKHQHHGMMVHKLKEDDVNFNEWFKDENNKYKTPGSRIFPKKLCKTLSLIANSDGNDFYNGTLSKMILEDIKEIGGIITAEDLRKYEVQWMDPISFKFQNEDTLYTAPPPGSGAILSLILGILDGYGFNRSSIEDLNATLLTYHRIIEAYKYSYAKRTELGDMNFVNISDLLTNITSREYADNIRSKIMDNATFQDPKHYGAVYYDKGDHGTAHISIIDQNGDAISVTSSINLFFGAGLTSKQTGIIFNSVMDDFSFPYFINYFGLPGSPHNELRPEKRPVSSMSPTIMVDKNGDAKMVVGAAGGSVITTSVAWTIIRSLWFGENIKEAVDAPRIHHQLYPMQVMYEYGVLEQVIDGLKSLGHKTKRSLISVICALKKEKGQIIANADYRKGGDVYGLT